MGVDFDRAGALEAIALRVDTGVEVTSMRIQGLAKSLAPVRKGRKGASGRHRGGPIPVGFYRAGSGQRVDTQQALAEIGAAIGTTRRATQAALNTSSLRGKAEAHRLRTLGEAMDKAGLMAKPAVRSPKSSVEYRTRQDITRLHGVRIDEDTGEAVLGGTLRKSIHATDVQRSGKKIEAAVLVDAPYAKYVEFPTRRTRAQPFLLPAFKRYGTVQALGREIKKAGG